MGGTSVKPRWQVGVRAAFGFPVVVADVCIGVLNCHRDTAGRLTETQVADALVVAEARGAASCRGRPTPRRAESRGSSSVGNHRVVVHQAAGRVSVQAEVSVSDAMALMGAHAFSHDSTVLEIAGRSWPGGCVSMRDATVGT